MSSGNSGGVGFVVKRQLESLKSKGVDVDIYLLKGKGFIGYLKGIRPLRKYLNEHKYDLVHAH